MPGTATFDLWGNQVEPQRRARAHSETFQLDSDLSYGERWAVAEALRARAAEIDGGDEIFKAAAIKREAERYERCGLDAITLECPHDLEQYYVRARCRSRICEPCGRVHKKELHGQLKPLVSKCMARRRKGWGVAMLTLTVTSARWGDRMPTVNELRRFRRETHDFMRLYFGKWRAHRSRNGRVVETRRRKCNVKPGDDPRIWKGAGWAGALEFGADNNNAHCHFLVYGPYVDWYRLKSAWEKITGDSSGVFIRRLRSAGDAVEYVLKYVTKPPVSDSYTRIADYAIAIKGTRRIRTGGILFGKVRRRQERRQCRCVHCGSTLRANYATVPLSECEHRLDLWHEYRRIESAHRAREPAILPDRDTPGGQPADYTWLIVTTWG